jgi:hypothetical protein
MDMDSQTVFAALRDALAELYPEERNTRVLVSDAGLAAKQITFSSRARTNWHNILTEALRQKRCEQLLEFVRNDYPDNRRLQEACAAYAHLLAQGGPPNGWRNSMAGCKPMVNFSLEPAARKSVSQ